MKIQWIITIIAFILVGCTAGAENKGIEVSGTIKEGLRVVLLDIEKTGETLHFYRGDYVQFLLPDSRQAQLTIPEMDVDLIVPIVDTEKPYIKFKTTGSFSYSLDNQKGTIVVHEYIESHYKEVTSKDAQKIFKDRAPLILDVRTKGEYNRGHIQNSILIPVQELQRRVSELDEYKDKPIFIYCATGNRSTVASKILLDNGFSEIYNLRYGISGWIRNGYEVVQ